MHATTLIALSDQAALLIKGAVLLAFLGFWLLVLLRLILAPKSRLESDARIPLSEQPVEPRS